MQAWKVEVFWQPCDVPDASPDGALRHLGWTRSSTGREDEDLDIERGLRMGVAKTIAAPLFLADLGGAVE